MSLDSNSIIDASSVKIRIFKNGKSEVTTRHVVDQANANGAQYLLFNIVPGIDQNTLMVNGTEAKTSVPAYNVFDEINSVEHMLKMFRGKHVIVTYIHDKSVTEENMVALTGIMDGYNNAFFHLKSESGVIVSLRVKDINKKFLVYLAGPAERMRIDPHVWIHIKNPIKDFVDVDYISSDMAYAYTHSMSISQTGTEVAWFGKVEVRSKNTANISNAVIELVDTDLSVVQKTGFHHAEYQRARSLSSTSSSAAESSPLPVSSSSNVLRLDEAITRNNIVYPIHFNVMKAEVPCSYFHLINTSATGGRATRMLRIKMDDVDDPGSSFFPGDVVVHKKMAEGRELLGHTHLDINTQEHHFVDIAIGTDQSIKFNRVKQAEAGDTEKRIKRNVYEYTIVNNNHVAVKMWIRETFESASPTELSSSDPDTVKIEKIELEKTNDIEQPNVRDLKFALPSKSTYKFKVHESYVSIN